MRPARSRSTPRLAPSGDAATPAAHSTVRASMRRAPMSTPSASMRVTAAPVCTSTPSRSSWRRARSDSSGGIDASTRVPASTRWMRARPGSQLRNSRGKVWRAISARVPASSTPVGPPPMITNSSQCACRTGSVSRSAASNAASMRRRMRSASPRVFSPGASPDHSSWPKYAWRAPVATTSQS